MQNQKLNSNSNVYPVFMITTAMLCAVVKMLIFAQSGYGDSDYFWHCILGRHIIETRSIPAIDIFSWISVENGYLETAHSWLGSILVYLCSSLIGDTDMGAMVFIGLSTFAISLFLCSKFGRVSDNNDFINGVAASLIALSPLLFPTAARPMNIGILCFAISLYLLNDTYENPQSKKYLFLPVVSVLWANVHGGAIPILFAFNGLFFIMSLFPKFCFCNISQEEGFNKQRSVKLFSAGVADVLAGLLNPYGYKLYIYFFITNNETTKKYVGEWQHPGLNFLPLIVCLVVLAVILLTSSHERKIKFNLLMPVLATLVMTGKYVRIYVYLIIAIIMLLSDYLSNITYDIKLKGSSALIRKLAVTLAIVSIVIGSLSIFLAPELLAEAKSEKDSVLTTDMLGAINELAPQRMYNDYDVGGELIYHGYKSFIDSRADPFPDDVLENGMLFSFGKMKSIDEICDYVEKYGFDAVLLQNSSPTKMIFEFQNNWSVYYADDYYTLFSKN